jgi:mono/diheme cytochrome c family protein
MNSRRLRNHVLRATLFLGAGLLISSCSIPMPAQDGATLYRSKCLACHGETGAGRPAIKGSNLLTDAAKKRSDAELSLAIAQGGENKNAAHAYETKGVTPNQVQALVKYVRELQSKQKP